MIPKGLAPDLVCGGFRFSETILRKQPAEARWPSARDRHAFGVNRGAIVMKPVVAEAGGFAEKTDLDVLWVDVDTPTTTEEPATLSISQMAEKFKVTPRALRFYESKGLLSPTRDRKARLYGPTDQQHLAVILKGRRLGFTLAEIARMIDVNDGRASRQSLKLTRQDCLDQIAKFSKQIRESLDAVAELQRLYASLSEQ
jgi:DNA-binding transcriptional MerR regulator